MQANGRRRFGLRLRSLFHVAQDKVQQHSKENGRRQEEGHHQPGSCTFNVMLSMGHVTEPFLFIITCIYNRASWKRQEPSMIPFSETKRKFFVFVKKSARRTQVRECFREISEQQAFEPNRGSYGCRQTKRTVAAGPWCMPSSRSGSTVSRCLIPDSLK